MSKNIIKGAHYQLMLSVALRSTVILAAFIIFLISSYLYGPEGRGTISFLTSFYLSLSLVISLGLGRVIYQRISIDPGQTSALLHTIFRFIYVVSAAVFLIIILGELLLKDYLHISFKVSPLYFLLFFLSLPYYIWLNLSNYLLGVTQKTSQHDRIIFSTRLLQVLLIGSLCLFKPHIEYFIFLFGLSGYLIFIIESRLLRFEMKSTAKPSWRESVDIFKGLLKETTWPFIDSIAQAANPLTVFILGLAVSQTDLGHYNFALQILATLTFPLVVFQVKLQEKFALNLLNGGASIIKKSFLFILPLSLIIAVCGLVIPPLIPLAGLTSFSDSMPMFKALLLSLPITGASCVFQGIWVGKHRARLSSLINITTASLNLVIVAFFVSRYGVYAGIIGAYISGILGILIQTYSLFRNWNNIAIIDPSLSGKSNA